MNLKQIIGRMQVNKIKLSTNKTNKMISEIGKLYDESTTTAKNWKPETKYKKNEHKIKPNKRKSITVIFFLLCFLKKKKLTRFLIFILVP